MEGQQETTTPMVVVGEQEGSKYYNEQRKKYIYKYRETHLETCKKINRNYFNKRYQEDPEFREKQKKKALERYYNKKQKTTSQEEPKQNLNPE